MHVESLQEGLKIDWFQFTIFNLIDPVTDFSQAYEQLLVKKIISLFPYEWQRVLSGQSFQVKNGLNGYKYRFCFNCGFSINFGTCENCLNDMGINVILSGDFFEILRYIAIDSVSLSNIKQWWYGLDLSPYSFKLSRIDICLDTKIDFSLFYNAFIKGEYLTRFRKDNCRDDCNAHKRGSLYFGSRSSDKFLRIYDKRLEVTQNNKNDDIKEFLDYVDKKCNGSLTRIELCLRHKNCDLAMNYFDDVEYVLGLFNSCVIFRYFVGYDENRNKKYETYEWWLLLVGDIVVKTPLIVKSSINYEWFYTVVIPAIKAFEKAQPKQYKLMYEEAKVSANLYDRFKVRNDLDFYRALKDSVKYNLIPEQILMEGVV